MSSDFDVWHLLYYVRG